MRIVNRTCYNTDDIVCIWNELRKACEADRLGRRYYSSSLAREPVAMQICYYAPKEKPERYWRFSINTRKHPDRPARLAIIKPDLLFTSPLQKLAAAADEELVLPPEIVRDIASGLAESIYYFHKNIAHNDWGWIDAYKIRYRPENQVLTFEVKRGVAELKIAELQDKLRCEDAKRRGLLQSANAVAKKMKKIEEQIIKASQRLGAL